MNPPEPQMAIRFSEVREPESCWLGLATDNRRLFDALQDGWLRPQSSDGQMIGIGTYVRDGSPVDAGHPIHVQVRLDPAKLPNLDIDVLRNKSWRTSCIGALEPTDQALYWPGALPTFAISELLVSTEEERARFTGMARYASNLILPKELVRVSAKPGDCFDVEVSPPKATVGIGIPSDMDAIHGAIAMAVWGVPRIDPWLDILTTSLDPEQSGLEDLAAKMDASWWRFPPWMRLQGEVNSDSLHDRLWLAAVEVFRSQVSGERIDPRELSTRIHDRASQSCPAKGRDEQARAWLETTNGILRAESVIQLQDWRSCPVGIAIQLVLARPDPTNFKTWFKDMPQLPPAIAWSAAVLCGLLHGYRRLDCQFRGMALQRELLSIQALRLSVAGKRDIYWPSVTARKPEWRRAAGRFVLAWDGNDFSTKPENARGQWFGADFKKTKVQEEAHKLATNLNWPCLSQQIILTDVLLPYSGPGTMRLPTNKDTLIEVEGTVRIQLPENLEIEKKLNVDRFRHFIATEAGPLSNPPASSPAGETQPRQSAIPGLIYIQDFLSEDEEDELVRLIDSYPWDTQLKRRVQHYGWRYAYKARQVDPSMRLGPLPDWADKLAGRLVSEGLVPQLPDQVIVNEYFREQGISAHVDSNSFADHIVTISLLESWGMVFRKKGSKNKVEQVLERRSAAIMSGEARYDWKHGIPMRKSERNKSGKGRRNRGRRISLTFRKVNNPV